MEWSKKPLWLQGGLTGFYLYLLYLLVKFSFKVGGFMDLSFWEQIDSISTASQISDNSWIFVLVPILIISIICFTIGTLIGFGVEKIRSKNNVNENNDNNKYLERKEQY